MTITYREMLRDPRWQKKRLEIMSRDGFRCRLCGDAETTLNVHHLRYARGAAPWEYPERSLVTVCEPCHESLHGMAYGESYVEALVAGGATQEVLARLAGMLDAAFLCAGSSPIPQADWVRVMDTLASLILDAQMEAARGGQG
jgi:hypothetical protein